MRVDIIYEDQEILIVHKPAGLATQTSRVGQIDVVSELKNYLQQSYLAIIHRLDQPVEGLLVFAKNKQAAAFLTRELREGILNKQYYALVCGKTEEEEGTLVDYLCKVNENGGKAITKVVTEQMGENKIRDAKFAELKYKRKRKLTNEIYLMDIQIETGRFHQIRAQMSHAGMPLLGDVKYGNKESIDFSRKYGVQTVALCAYRLDLKHPASKKKMSFEIPLDEWMEIKWKSINA